MALQKVFTALQEVDANEDVRELLKLADAFAADFACG